MLFEKWRENSKEKFSNFQLLFCFDYLMSIVLIRLYELQKNKIAKKVRKHLEKLTIPKRETYVVSSIGINVQGKVQIKILPMYTTGP